jgi:hypothetical protein
MNYIVDNTIMNDINYVQQRFKILKYCDLFEVVIKNISHMKLPDDFRRLDC